MKKVILRPITGGQKAVELNIGKTIIGRGPLLECSDKKVSRNHAVLEVTQDGDVLITPTHVNPCFYQAQGRGPSKVMKKDKQHPLFPGDSISLLPNNYKYVVHVTGHVGDSPESVLQDANGDGKEEADGRETAGAKGADGGGGEPENGAESPEATARPPQRGPSHEGDTVSLMERIVGAPKTAKRTLPQWLLDSAGTRGSASDTKASKGKRADRTAAKKPPKRQARPRYTFSESEPDVEDDDDVDYVAFEVEDGRSRGDARRRGREERSCSRSSRKNRATMQKISLDDFVASDDDEWENSSEDTRPRRRRRHEEDSGSDWEEENKRGKRTKRYPSSDSESASDWEWGGRRKKPATRVRSHRRKKSSSEESEASDGKLPPGRGGRRKREDCKYGGRCFRRNAQHKKQYSHPGDSDYEEEEEESEEEDCGNEEAKEGIRPVCQYGADCYRRNELHRKTFDHPDASKRSMRHGRDETKGTRNRGEKTDEKKATGDEYEWKDEEDERGADDTQEETKGFAGRRRRRLRNEVPDD